MRLFVNNLQRQKTILILNDSHTLLLSINGNCMKFCFKGQINQDFDIFSFNPIYLLCVDLVSNKHILKFQVNWT